MLSAPPSTRHPVRSGFSLVELALVLVISGVLASIVLPNLRPADFRLSAATREVATVLAAAQSRAVLQGHDMVLAFDTATGRIRIHADADNDGAVDAGEAVGTYELGEGVLFGRAGAPPLTVGGSAAAAAVTTGHVQGGLPALTFARNGSASRESAVYLTSPAGLARDTRALEIQRATGRVRCHTYQSGSWSGPC